MSEVRDRRSSSGLLFEGGMVRFRVLRCWVRDEIRSVPDLIVEAAIVDRLFFLS